MEKNHDFTYYFLFRPCCLDLTPAGGTNPIDLLEPHGALVNDCKDFFPKCVHQLLGVDRTDTFDQATANILFNALTRTGSIAGNRIGLELQPMFSVPYPSALSGNPLTGVNACHYSDHR